MAHDVSSISFPLTHRVNVFGLALFVINGTSKAQCDTFLRIWVCQGHINIINEQEADWREGERRGDRNRVRKKTGREYLFSSVIWCIFTWGFDDDCIRAAILSDGETVCAQRSCVITYQQHIGGTDGSRFLFFPLNPFGKITSPFALSCPVAKNSEVYKGNFPAHLCEDSYIYLGM